MFAAVQSGKRAMLVLNVPDMSCNHCVMTIEKAVHGVDASARVASDLAAKSVAIESAADPLAIRAAMAEAGYESTPA